MKKVVVILFRDVRIEGVHAVVEIPKGKTADEAYDQWLDAEARQMEVDEGEKPDLDRLRENYPAEVMEVTTLK